MTDNSGVILEKRGQAYHQPPGQAQRHQWRRDRRHRQGTALAAGLLNYVVPAAELDAKLDWLIGRIVDKSPTAIRRGKYAMRAIASMSFDESIAYTESQIALLAMTEDAKEGLKAFSEKRKPSWPGK